MAKKKLIFKEEYQRANKIALYNKTLGRHLKLTKDQILTMAAFLVFMRVQEKTK